VYNNIVYDLLNGKNFKEAYDDSISFAENYFKASIYEQAFKKLMDYEFWEYSGTGYVFDCFWSSIYAIRATKGFHEALEFCIKLGNDTDTTATVCGGIAGIIYGIDSMNPKWIEKIAGKKLIDEIFGEL
jgi:ADP-ribosylglycohydrolase